MKPSTRFADRAYRCIQALTIMVAIGVAAFCYKTGSQLNFSDERQYLEIAQNLADGAGYSLSGEPTAYRPPGWPFLLVPLTAISAPLPVISLIPALCLIGASWIAARLGVWLTGNRFGILAGAAILAYPINIYAAGTLYPQAFATALLLGIWYLVSRTEDRGRNSMTIRASILLGALAAVLSLSVPTMVFTSAAVLLWLFYRQSGNRIRFGLAAGAGFAAPIAAWTVRNLLTLGSPVTLSTSSGVNLLLGNSENTSATNGLSADISHYREDAKQLGLDELGRNSYFSEKATDWIHAHPADAAALYFGKLANYLSAYNEPATAGQHSIPQMLVAWFCAGVIVALVALRIYLHFRGLAPVYPSEGFFLILFLLNGPVMAVFFTRVRFRQPLDAILLVEAAVAVVALMATINRGKRPELAFRVR